MAAYADSDSDSVLSESELNALTVAQLKALAVEEGFIVTKTKKAEIIEEILRQI